MQWSALLKTAMFYTFKMATPHAFKMAVKYVRLHPCPSRWNDFTYFKDDCGNFRRVSLCAHLSDCRQRIFSLLSHFFIFLQRMWQPDRSIIMRIMTIFPIKTIFFPLRREKFSKDLVKKALTGKFYAQTGPTYSKCKNHKQTAVLLLLSGVWACPGHRR